MKKIVHINAYGCFRGGAENYILETSRHLNAFNHCLLYLRDGQERYLSEFASTYNVNNFDEQIESVLCLEKPDIVIIYRLGSLSLERVFLMRKKLGYKVICSIHDYQMVSMGTGYNPVTLRRNKAPVDLRSIMSCVCRDAFTRKLQFQSIAHKRKLISELNCADAIEIHTEDMKKTLIDNGISKSKMFLNPPWSETVPHATNNAQNGSVLFVGNLIRGKGPHLLLQALRQMKHQYNLTIVGDGYMRADLEQYVRKHKLNVQFMGDVEKEDMDSLYRSCQFVVVPSILEAFGFVIVESMSRRKCVVAFDIGGIPETIKDGVNGCLVKPFRIQSLAKKMGYLISNRDVADEMGVRGYEIFLQRFTLARHMETLEKKINELCRGANG